MTDSRCPDCDKWELAHTDQHLAKVCLPAMIRRLNLQIEDVKKNALDWQSKAFQYEEQRDNALRLNGELRKALEKIEGMRGGMVTRADHATDVRMWYVAHDALADKRKDVKLCYKCGRQEATENFAVCPSCYKDPIDG